MGYLTKEVVFNPELDSIYLAPNAFELQADSVSNIDLKKKLQHVLEQYEELYATSPVVFEGTYKESLKVENQLARLSQVQLNWWNKSYKYDFDKPVDKQNQMSLTAIDYFKFLTTKPFLPMAGSWLTQTFFSSFI